MKETEPAEGQYVYAIVACEEPHEFKTRGIGERGDLVRTINYRRIAAVVSNSAISEYDNSRRNMMAHMLVLEEAMEHFTLLPVRFGSGRCQRTRARAAPAHATLRGAHRAPGADARPH